MVDRPLVVLGVLATPLLVACGATRASEPIAGPLPLVSGVEVEGRRVFMQHCHACHVLGEGGLGPPLNDKPLPDFAMRFQVRQGVGAMPAFSEEEIDDRELDGLLAYVRALREHRRERSDA
jgi:mono/diheme cytochrome c family protein